MSATAAQRSFKEYNLTGYFGRGLVIHAQVVVPTDPQSRYSFSLLARTLYWSALSGVRVTTKNAIFHPFLEVRCNFRVQHTTSFEVDLKETAMPRLQPIEHVIANSPCPIYVIDWNRSPEHGSPESLPGPVKEWLETKYPEVAIGRLDCPQAPEPQPSALGGLGQRITASTFILGFNAKQADAFVADFSCQPSKPPKSPDFYFVRCAPRQLGALIRWHVSRVRQRLLG